MSRFQTSEEEYEAIKEAEKLIPAIGYGTWQSPDSEITVEGVKAAISNGYRHIDAAAVYGNEQSVGKGISECGIPREELFITSKVRNTERGYKKTLVALALFKIFCKRANRDVHMISGARGRASG